MIQAKLASLAHHRVQKSQAQIEAALTGDYRPELLFVLGQSLQNYRQIQQQITQCDLSIEKQLAKMTDCATPRQAAEPMPSSPNWAVVSRAKENLQWPWKQAWPGI